MTSVWDIAEEAYLQFEFWQQNKENKNGAEICRGKQWSVLLWQIIVQRGYKCHVKLHLDDQFRSVLYLSNWKGIKREQTNIAHSYVSREKVIDDSI